jgi:hypothetical protein
LSPQQAPGRSALGKDRAELVDAGTELATSALLLHHELDDLLASKRERTRNARRCALSHDLRNALNVVVIPVGNHDEADVLSRYAHAVEIRESGRGVGLRVDAGVDENPVAVDMNADRFAVAPTEDGDLDLVRRGRG